VITSPANEKLKLVRKLQSESWRRKLGLFVAEGEDLVEAAHAAGVEPVELLVAGETVAPELLASVSDLPHPPRVVAVYRRADLPCNTVLLGVALWRVVDPGNVGAIVRTAGAFGASVALSDGCADPTSPRALRASAGALFRVPLATFDDAPGRLVALVAHRGTPLAEIDLAQPVTFVLGAEREGLPDDVVARCEAVATIPISSAVESLNVAAAAAIALYEAAEHRVAAGPPGMSTESS
jgi:TrmH family RNA methyltransferase